MAQPSVAPSGAEALNERLAFMGFAERDKQALLRFKSLIETELPKALDVFYAQVRATPETKRFFASENAISGAKTLQIKHWELLSNGAFTQDYYDRVRRIGETHARIGLEPRWYVAAYALVTEHLVKAALTRAWPKSWINLSRAEAASALGDSLAALLKGIFLDMELSISVYLEASERKRVEGEAAAIAGERKTVIEGFGGALASLSAKDLTYRVADGVPAAYDDMKESFNSAVQQLANSFLDVANSAHSVSAGAQQVATGSNDLARRAEQQASSLEETAAALEQITTAVDKSAGNVKAASGLVARARADATEGAEIVSGAMDAMKRIEDSSKEIHQIIGVIDEIAFQTNLLALNAGVEAARAGDAGRGFAVVASEVRALAQRSAQAAKQIKDLISASSREVSQGVELVDRTRGALRKVEGGVGEIDKLMSEIAGSAEEQAKGLKEINIAVSQMDEMTQQNAAMAEEASAAGKAMLEESQNLSAMIGTFKLGQALTEKKLRAEVKRVAPHVFAKPASGAPARTKPALRQVANGSAAPGGDWAEF